MRRIASGFALLTPPLLLLAICPAGCGGAPPEDQDGGAAAFIAVQGDFACYRTWNMFDGGTAAFDGLGADGDQRTLYLNRLPPPGSTTFPSGTIIVKETQNAQTFAMAKRGGGFNPQVNGWEWFELTTGVATPSSACAPVINWRGATPPVGGPYGGQFVSCNGCHAQSAPNDFVAGDALVLLQL